MVGSNLLINIFNRFRGIRFLVIGTTNSVICFFLYAGLLKLHLYYLLASLLTFITGVLFGFMLNSLVVFKHKPHFIKLTKYFGLYCITCILNLSIMYLFVDILSLNKLLAQIFTMGIIAVLNYYLIKIFVFKL